jgi:uncharacterized RDD family membrane protein YckC
MVAMPYPEPAESVAKPLYARFSRRLRAIVIDWALLWVAIVATMLVAIAIGSNDTSRILGTVLIAAALLYEPILVSAIGSTVGHYFTNLRIVGDRDGRNLSFARATVRFLLKWILGLFSFVAMMATRRNQAFHDVLTHSTVQIRDPQLADPDHYIDERTEFSDAGMPSKTRRLLVIAAYLAGVWILTTLMFVVLAQTGLMSATCITSDRCTYNEQLLNVAVSLMWLGLTGVCIGLGWRGRIFGAQRQIPSNGE